MTGVQTCALPILEVTWQKGWLYFSPSSMALCILKKHIKHTMWLTLSPALTLPAFFSLISVHFLPLIQPYRSSYSPPEYTSSSSPNQMSPTILKFILPLASFSIPNPALVMSLIPLNSVSYIPPLPESYFENRLRTPFPSGLRTVCS